MKKISSVLNEIRQNNKVLTKDAYDFLLENIDRFDTSKFFSEIGKIDKVFINVDILKKYVVKKEYESKQTDIKILFNPGEKITRGEGLKEFSSLIRYRYNYLKKSILKKMRVKSVDLLATLALEKKQFYYVIGLIYSKRVRKDRIIIELEDETSIKEIYINKKFNPKVYDLVYKIPLDSVIGFKVRLIKNRFLVSEDVYFPITEFNDYKLNEDIYAIFTSDLHVGSDKFLEDHFKLFIDMLNGKNLNNELLNSIIPRIRYILIAGDLVDGIGVFPNQEKELLINDIRGQYRYLYNLLSKVPNRIKIIMIPGNHDATRKSLPQPPIIEEYAYEFYHDKKFILLGNPVNICLQGVNIYMYHGDFLQDAFTMIPGTTQENINNAMKVLLMIRHAAPTFGGYTRIAPEPSDKLIIPEKINIFHTGHVHRISLDKYNGILMINSGTWQLQTNYQKMNGYNPTPGIVPIINLRTLKTYLINLME